MKFHMQKKRSIKLIYCKIKLDYMFNSLGLRPKMWPYSALVEGRISAALYSTINELPL
jgi:hypothetical protein